MKNLGQYIIWAAILLAVIFLVDYFGLQGAIINFLYDSWVTLSEFFQSLFEKFGI